MKTNYSQNMAQIRFGQGISAKNMSRIERGITGVVPLVGIELGAGKIKPELVKGQMRSFEHAPRGTKPFEIAQEIFHTANELQQGVEARALRVSGELTPEELKDIGAQKMSSVMRVAVEIGSGKINPAKALGQLKTHTEGTRHNATVFALKSALEALVNPSESRHSKAFKKAFASSETTTEKAPSVTLDKAKDAFAAIFAPKKNPQPQKANTPAAAFEAVFK